MNFGKWFIMLVVMLAFTGAVLAENNDTNSTENTNSTNSSINTNSTLDLNNTINTNFTNSTIETNYTNNTTNNTYTNSTNSTNYTNNTNITHDSDADINVTNGQALSVRYDHLQCKVTFTNTQIDLLKKYVSVDQTANKNKLLTDMTNLKAYVVNTNKDGFDNYTTQTVRPDLQKATEDLNNAKKNFKQYNVSNESRTAFINELKSAKAAYSSCVDDKEIKMANVMKNHMDNWNKHWGNIANRMVDKNITMDDAKALQAEIAAKNAELSALIAEGNITKIAEFMKTYHEAQLHYAARFEISRLKGYRDKLAPIADRFNMSDKIHDIDNKIANAENYTKPGHKYQAGEFQDTWNDIKGAGQDMKDAAKDINAERVKERQNKTADKLQKIENKQQNKQQSPKMPQGRNGRGPQDINKGNTNSN